MRGASGPLCIIALELLHPNPGTDVRQASLSVFIGGRMLLIFPSVHHRSLRGCPSRW